MIVATYHNPRKVTARYDTVFFKVFAHRHTSFIIYVHKVDLNYSCAYIDLHGSHKQAIIYFHIRLHEMLCTLVDAIRNLFLSTSCSMSLSATETTQPDSERLQKFQRVAGGLSAAREF